MMEMPTPLVKEVVLVGGGHTHALLLRHWGMHPVPGARLTVINPAPTAPYTGMLPGFVAGYYRREELEIDLVKLARFAGARLILGWVEAMNPEARLVTVAGRPPVPFDLASIDIGITTDMPEIPGFAEHAVAAKPLGPFATRWRAFLDGGAGDIAVIGGGVAGVELALTAAFALEGRGKVTVIETATALAGLADSTTRTVRGRMRDAGVTLMEGATARKISEAGVTLDNGRTVSARLTVGAAGARPFGWLSETGLDLTDGFITVDEHLRSVSHPNVYATGDCAHYAHAPRPKAGVFAVRAAPVLRQNLAADLTGGRPSRFKPQRHYLKLITLGNRSALADKWGRSASGGWAWRWKDRIDRAFMDRLNNPPTMARAAPPANAALGTAEALGPKPLCGGCGSKVGPDVLTGALSRLPAPRRDDIETRPGGDAAVLLMGGMRQAISTDHLRPFWNDPWLMARIAAIHALNDVLASGAEPQAALAQITLPQMSPAMQETWLAEILDAASGVFQAEGAGLVGGHTSIGPELSLGFTVTGLAGPKLPTACGGDALILTGALGSGTVLAAEMEGKARGDDVAALLTAMAQLRGDAARALWPYSRAMTDVTGFGLAGHLARMAGEAGLSAEVDLAALPVHAGAETLAAGGIRSSIWEANRAAVRVDSPDTPRAILLFDPQTAGGFLAAVSPDSVDEILSKLQTTGTQAACIGRLTASEVVAIKAR